MLKKMADTISEYLDENLNELWGKFPNTANILCWSNGLCWYIMVNQHIA